MISREEFSLLLKQYARDTCSAEDRQFIERMVLRNPRVNNWQWEDQEKRSLMKIRIKTAIDERRFSPKPLLKVKRWYIGIAASLLMVMSFALFLLDQDLKGNKKQLIIDEQSSVISKGITLKFANGRAIDLEQQANGIISRNQGLIITKTAGHQLVYTRQTNHKNNFQLPVTNTIHVPNGKQFQVVLADGTKVWLNTGSTLIFPSAFAPNSREVSLDGEAYFEVAHDSKRPFSVFAQGTQVAVLGTKFNVSNYNKGKQVYTTLLEGSVNIKSAQKSKLLSPGFQAITGFGSHGVEIQKVNTENIIAWSQGYFVFDGKDIVSVMREIARWYDVRVIIEDGISSPKIGGTYPMMGKLEDLLKDLDALSGLKFVKKGKEVKVFR